MTSIKEFILIAVFLIATPSQAQFEHCDAEDAKCVGEVLLNAIYANSNPRPVVRVLPGTYARRHNPSDTRDIRPTYQGTKLISIQFLRSSTYQCENNFYCISEEGYNLNVISSGVLETAPGDFWDYRD